MQTTQPAHVKWQDREHHRRSHKPHHGMGDEIGHWVLTTGLLSPLIIGEFVKDAEKKLRFIRIASVAAAVLSEGLHSHKTHREREYERKALEACEAPGRAFISAY